MGIGQWAVYLPPCLVCGRRRPDDGVLCRACAKTARRITNAERLYVFVDGSFRDGKGGAGLVLVSESLAGRRLAERTCSFLVSDAHMAEYQAIVRGARWAPGAVVLSDCLDAVAGAKRRGMSVVWLPTQYRKPHHDRAHALATHGRQSALDYSKLWKLNSAG